MYNNWQTVFPFLSSPARFYTFGYFQLEVALQRCYQVKVFWEYAANLLKNTNEITLRHKCSSVKLLQIFRLPFLKNTPGGLLMFNKVESMVTASTLKVMQDISSSGMISRFVNTLLTLNDKFIWFGRSDNWINLFYDFNCCPIDT